MNIVVAGGGKIGSVLIDFLSQEGHDIVLIDKDENVLDTLINQNDITGLVGQAENYEDLMEAGTHQADIFIAVTAKDEVNIISSLIAKKVGAKATVARVRNPDYKKHKDFFNKEMGISLIVNPELESAKEMKKLLAYPESLSVESFENGTVNIHEFKVDEKSSLVGSDLFSFRKDYGDVLVVMIKRGAEVIIPSGPTTILADDRIFVTGDETCISSFIESLGINERKTKSIMMVGGGIAGYYLLEMVKNSGIHVKIIENNEKKARTLSQAFPNLEIIKGDGTDQALLDEERIETYDAFIAYTGIDEENLLTSLYAQKKGIYKILTKVSRTALLELLDDANQNSVISPKTYAANHILKFVRNLQFHDSSEVEAIHKIADSKAEVSQILIINESKVIGKKLMDLNISPRTMLAAIIRDNKLIFPGGSSQILLNDRLIIVSTDKIRTIEDILGD